MKLTAFILCALFAFALLHAAPVNTPAGKNIFERRCSGCHALDINKEGPRLRGVFGRRSGAVDSFTYSDGLKNLNTPWNDASLDRWLTDPGAVVADTDMAFRLSDAGERKAIIDYLKSLSR